MKMKQITIIPGKTVGVCFSARWYHITDPVDGWVFGGFLE